MAKRKNPPKEKPSNNNVVNLQEYCALKIEEILLQEEEELLKELFLQEGYDDIPTIREILMLEEANDNLYEDPEDEDDDDEDVYFDDEDDEEDIED